MSGCCTSVEWDLLSGIWARMLSAQRVHLSDSSKYPRKLRGHECLNPDGKRRTEPYWECRWSPLTTKHHIYEIWDTYCLIETEKEEIFEVMVAYTVTYPRTVVVHLEHTLIANRAMVSPLWLPVPAHVTIRIVIRRRHLCSLTEVIYAWNSFRSFDWGFNVSNESHGDTEVKHDLRYLGVHFVLLILKHFLSTRQLEQFETYKVD